MQAQIDPLHPFGTRLAEFASTRVIVPLAVLVGVSLLFSVFAIYRSVHLQEALQREAEARAVTQGVRTIARALTNEVRDYAWWDDAVHHLVLEPDADWADANVGRYIYQSFGYDLSLVLDEHGRSIFGQVEGTSDPDAARDRLGPELPLLIAELDGHDRATAFAVLHGMDGLYATAAATIVPEAGSPLTVAAGGHRTLVFAERLAEEFLTELGTDFGLTGLNFHAAPADPTRPAAVLPSLAGTAAAYIQWTPADTGRAQLFLMLPGLLGTILFCGIAALLIHARDRVYREIRESDARFRDISQTATDWIWETDPELRLTFVSDACQRSLELNPEELVGRPLHELLRPQHGSTTEARDVAELAAVGPFAHAVYRAQAGSGEDHVLRVAGKAVWRDGALLGYRGIATDVTAEIGALEQARFLAHHDALTGLPNRVLLQDRLDEAAARCRRRGIPAAVLCLDLDGFKEINDTLGHTAGDLLLVRCGERLRGCVRGGDTVARQGGDEFAILQTDIERPADVEMLCRRIVEAVALPFDLDGPAAQVTVSIGVAVMPEDGDDAARLLQQADLALYRAKSGGRNQYCFYEAAMDRQLRERRQAETDLRAALVHGGLQLLYQPQVDCVSGALVGVEALLRWRHPVRGMLPPAEIIPLAEETGAIHALGAWVLRTACADGTRWGELHVSVNVSPVQFRQADFVATVAGALADSGLAPRRLELEVTEGLLVHDNGTALAVLAELKALGVRITMDDFGTGYSSLAYLHRFPFDKIKIDRSFIRQLGGRPNTQAIVRAMVQLGRSLAVPICAEGVETPGQLAHLRAEGCMEAQGFLFAHPVPAGDVADLVAGWRAEDVGKPLRLLTADGAEHSAA